MLFRSGRAGLTAPTARSARAGASSRRPDGTDCCRRPGARSAAARLGAAPGRADRDRGRRQFACRRAAAGPRRRAVRPPLVWPREAALPDLRDRRDRQSARIDALARDQWHAGSVHRRRVRAGAGTRRALLRQDRERRRNGAGTRSARNDRRWQRLLRCGPSHRSGRTRFRLGNQSWRSESTARRAPDAPYGADIRTRGSPSAAPTAISATRNGPIATRRRAIAALLRCAISRRWRTAVSNGRAGLVKQ